MKAKLFAIALIAAIAYASIACHRAYGDEPTIIDLNNKCVEVKYELLEAFEMMERIEAQGIVIPTEVIVSVIQSAAKYTQHCEDLTGPLHEEWEE